MVFALLPSVGRACSARSALPRRPRAACRKGAAAASGTPAAHGRSRALALRPVQRHPAPVLRPVQRHPAPARAAPAEAAGGALLEDQPVDWAATGAAFAVPALGGLLFGYDIGVTSAALVSVNAGGDFGVLAPFQSGLVVSGSLAGAMLASGVALLKGNEMGRRLELRLSACLYGAGALIMAGAPSLAALLLGRVVYGTGIGFAMHAAPIYIAETAPDSVRGTLISCKEAFIVGGILLGYVAGAVFIDTEFSWRAMLGVAALPAAVLGVGMLSLPESPRWLLVNGGADVDAAGAALRKLRGAAAAPEGIVERELARMEVGATASRASLEEEGGVWGALVAPKNRRALYAGMSLMLFQQITGQPSVLYYATDIFQKAGFASTAEATEADVVLGLFKLLMTGVAVLTVDKLGRRPLLLTGVTAMTASLLALGALSSATGTSSAYGSAACLLLYVGAYQISFGPISWLLVGEVFPADVRSAAVGAATLINFGSNFLVSLLLPSMEESLGQDGTYFFFAALGAVAVTSIALTAPETKGKSLEQIEAELSGEAPKTE